MRLLLVIDIWQPANCAKFSEWKIMFFSTSFFEGWTRVIEHYKFTIMYWLICCVWKLIVIIRTACYKICILTYGAANFHVKFFWMERRGLATFENWNWMLMEFIKCENYSLNWSFVQILIILLIATKINSSHRCKFTIIS